MFHSSAIVQEASNKGYPHNKIGLEVRLVHKLDDLLNDELLQHTIASNHPVFPELSLKQQKGSKNKNYTFSSLFRIPPNKSLGLIRVPHLRHED